MIAALLASADEERECVDGNRLRGTVGEGDLDTGADWGSSFSHRLRVSAFYQRIEGLMLRQVSVPHCGNIAPELAGFGSGLMGDLDNSLPGQ
jgi:hypothetical protein